MRIAQRDTAIQAFHGHRSSGKAGDQRGRIICFIAEKGGDWSIGELANALCLEKSTVSARLNEALITGELIERPKRKDKVSGILIRPVGLPIAGQQELFQ